MRAWTYGELAVLSTAGRYKSRSRSIDRPIDLRIKSDKFGRSASSSRSFLLNYDRIPMMSVAHTRHSDVRMQSKAERRRHPRRRRRYVHPFFLLLQ